MKREKHLPLKISESRPSGYKRKNKMGRFIKTDSEAFARTSMIKIYIEESQVSHCTLATEHRSLQGRTGTLINMLWEVSLST